jgi:hypothetical protein
MTKGMIMSVPTWVGSVLGVLSASELVWHGFHLGWSTPIRDMIEWYERLTHLFLGWAEGPFKEFLSRFYAWTGLHLDLLPHWKHITILLWLSFAAAIRAQSKSYEGATVEGRRGSIYTNKQYRFRYTIYVPIQNLLFMGCIAVIMGLIVGSLPAQYASREHAGPYLIALFLGTCLFFIGWLLAQLIIAEEFELLERVILGALALAFGVAVVLLFGSPDPLLELATFVVVGSALLDLAYSRFKLWVLNTPYGEGLKPLSPEEQNIADDYPNIYDPTNIFTWWNVRANIFIMTVVAGTLILVVTNSGLKYFGV